MNDKSVVFAKENRQKFLSELIGSVQARPTNKTAIFMAGTPGAGKSEVAESLKEVISNICVINADKYREHFPSYNGHNSDEFQRGAAWLVDYTLSKLIERHYSFILDGTFAFNRAAQNVQRALDHGYEVTIYYVYQEPRIAWNFTQIREHAEGRYVPKERFIHAYYAARANAIRVSAKFGNKVNITVVFKDFDNNIADTFSEVENISFVLPDEYTKAELEGELNE